ncbi:MAG TPA: homocysteine S-methyltransferase family protein [Terriglobales bacterium]|nr:homocysteine S-methyltransferase family protein [Terriglobales bacterium]
MPENEDLTTVGATPEVVAAAMVEAFVRRVMYRSGSKPNAGLPNMDGTTIRHGTSVEFFASRCAALREAAPRFLGGCCGSAPDFIRTL